MQINPARVSKTLLTIEEGHPVCRRAPFEIPNASAAAFARTLFRSRNDTIKR